MGGGTAHHDLVEYAELALNLETYQASIAGRPLDLTYMEYELLKFLAQNPGKVFTREMLLSRVWGYEYYGGARTVDVHVRRLRAKLGEEHAGLIQTVRSRRLPLRPEPLGLLTFVTRSGRLILAGAETNGHPERLESARRPPRPVVVERRGPAQHGQPLRRRGLGADLAGVVAHPPARRGDDDARRRIVADAGVRGGTRRGR